MIKHSEITDLDLPLKIKNQEVCLGGNSKLKIYGTLNCKSGKRMTRSNRVFFKLEKEATENGYRPCGNCMRSKYLIWKNGSV
ncbi:Ada metal-binding domain-containing protein [Daejeonella sp.]|uniref:Ada metal-binding domain-containing protein n=1 Tax=Daejeonella sp. TaxID=2805397 RepID=UPI0030C1B35E